MKSLMAVIFLLAMIPAFARTRVYKVFPATHGSVLVENQRADSLGLNRYETMREIRAAVEVGELLPFSSVLIDRRLPRDRRYARPETVAFVMALDTEFSEVTHRHLVIDSAVRPVEIQKRLRRWNRNAAPATGESASSHERGTTVDISRKMPRGHYRFLLVKLAYYKARGRILVIEERGCLHVFVGGNNAEQTEQIGYSQSVEDYLEPGDSEVSRTE